MLSSNRALNAVPTLRGHTTSAGAFFAAPGAALATGFAGSCALAAHTSRANPIITLTVSLWYMEGAEPLRAKLAGQPPEKYMHTHSQLAKPIYSMVYGNSPSSN